MKKISNIMAWLVTTVFVVTMAIPLVVERAVVTTGWETMFASLQVTDQSGQMHNGFIATGTAMTVPTDFLIYGYEAEENEDLSALERKFINSTSTLPKENGWLWANNNFKWTDYNPFGADVNLREAQRQGLEEPFNPEDEPHLILPGNPVDVETERVSILGKFPNYKVSYDNEHYTFDLDYVPYHDRWYSYNDDRPWRAGDFGIGSMQEIGCDVTGTITHKTTGDVFQVTGKGIIEGAQGIPYSWAEWATHDWMDMHFETNWGGSLYMTHDDWQWGYTRQPSQGWLWDPERKEYHQFYRLKREVVERGSEPLNGFDYYPAKEVWRAISGKGTLILESEIRSFIPREMALPGLPFGLRMVYGIRDLKATFIRRDGTMVDLGTGTGTIEYWPGGVFPDYVHYGPFILSLLVFAWGFRACVIHREKGESLAKPIGYMFAWWISIAALTAYWMQGNQVFY